jgi:hypothetical protein
MQRRPLVGLIAAVAAFLTLVVMGIVIAVGVIDRQSAIADHRTAVGELAEAVIASEAAMWEADQVIDLAPDPLLSVAAVAALTAERDAAAAGLDGAATLGADPEALDTARVRQLSADIRTLAEELGDDDALVLDALGDLVVVIRTDAAAIEPANFDAENQPHIAFRHAVAALDSAQDDGIGDSVLEYLEAAHALEASHAAELAEKVGPLFDRRMSVEQFARALSGGVLLDFDWAVTVNGYGTGGSYGGTSYWFADDGGYASITLSDSVAAMWPGAGVQALVAHEVGHAILSKCTDLFYDSDFFTGEAGQEESWATAWAIGMGYTADGNGESIYGRPSDGLIQLSTQCR